MLRDAGDIENALAVATKLAARYPEDADIEAFRESLRRIQEAR
jgi:hypothetical protein